MGSERVFRFGVTERTLHWVHAGAFGFMFATGLVLYLPILAQVVSARPLMKALHLAAAAAWLTALAVIALVGDRAALRRTRRELERFTDDDLRWLRRQHTPQGRFNAGQKAHAVAQAALAVLFTVSGTLLWLGERDTALRFGGTLALHDACMLACGVLVVGHVAKTYATPSSIEGMLDGTVPAAYAAEHHAKWTPPAAPSHARPRRALVAVALVVAVLGATGAVALARDALTGDAPQAASDA
jgi:formate dehydrogenase subunit gamma